MYYDQMNMYIIFVGIISLIYLLITVWQREKRNQRDFELKKMSMEFSIKNGHDPFDFQVAATVPVIKETVVSTDGYIIIELDESQRQSFEDILRGFEDYARLKGYRISVSFDTSIPDKFAFKFTLHENSVPVTAEKVKKDVQEFIRKVENGESINDIPSVITPSEHQFIITKLVNRINLINSNYNITKKSMDHLHDAITKFTVMNSPQIFIDVAGVNAGSIKQLNGGKNNMTTYQANNSQGVIQGEGNSKNIIDNSENKTKIRVGRSYIEKESQLNEIKKLISLIKQAPDSEENEEAIFNLKTVEKELKEVDKPDESKLDKYLRGASNALKTVEIGSELFTKASDVFNSFNLSDLINNMRG